MSFSPSSQQSSAKLSPTPAATTSTTTTAASAATTISAESSSGEADSTRAEQADNIIKRMRWSELRTLVETGRKLVSNLSGDVASNIMFRRCEARAQHRIYFLGNDTSRTRDITIKRIVLPIKRSTQPSAAAAASSTPCRKLNGKAILVGRRRTTRPSPAANFTQLTKEEQLLLERKRVSFSGITSYCMNEPLGRLAFTERSELFYFDDDDDEDHDYNENDDSATEFESSNEDEYESDMDSDDSTTGLVRHIPTASKGPIDVKLCPSNGNLVAYILNDNLWMQDVRASAAQRRLNDVNVASSTGGSSGEIQLTNTQSPVNSGVPSFAVKEEFDRYTGYWWQPQSANNNSTYRIVYEEIDNSPVEIMYMTPSSEGDYGYDTYRYPRAGTANTRVSLKMLEIVYAPDGGEVQAPTIRRLRMRKSFYQLFDCFEYLVKADWVANGQYFWVQIYNRLQSRMATVLIPLGFFVPDEDDEVMAVGETSGVDVGRNVLVLDEHTSDSWINCHNVMHFLGDESQPDVMSFISANDDTGFLHLYHHKLSLKSTDFAAIGDGVAKTTSLIKRQLTHGDWCVEYSENVWVDERNHLVYFMAYVNPLESHLFVVDYTGTSKPMRQLTTNGFSHIVSMNAECTLFVTTCSNLSTPVKTYIYSVDASASDFDKLAVTCVAQIVAIIKDAERASETRRELIANVNQLSSLLKLRIDARNDNDETAMLQSLFKPPQIFTCATNDKSSCKMFGMIYIPFNYEHGVKYPTLLYVYAGPHVQLVSNAFKATKFARFNMLALLGYCVVVIDSRGSNYRGQAFETHINRKMGTVEINDQVTGLEAAAKIFNCIDMKRVAIYGWSYGGYMSLMGIAQRPDIFKVAISGAPVTTWSLYDTAYTERYMGLPDDNVDAYEQGSVLNYVKLFPEEENRLLIIHGLIDDNVHFAHTRKLVDELIKEKKPYQLQIYPNERHGVRAAGASIHCDVNFYSFLKNNL